MERYTDAFYAELDNTALPSGRRIVPLLLDLVPAKSAVDVGCGNGAWLAVLKEHGVADLLGLDGAHMNRRHLRIAEREFCTTRLDQPLSVARRFDLALCLEVAEHLPPERAPGLVRELCALAPVVLFSAAVPGQGGVGHRNEQWPDYWCRLFEAEGFEALDVIRLRVWDDPAVTWWYAQNLLLFANERALSENPKLAKARACAPARPLSLVHPTLFAQKARLARPGLGRWLKMGLAAAARSLGKAFGRVSR